METTSLTFGPLVTLHRMSSKETKYFFDKFHHHPQPETVNTNVLNLYKREWMDRDDINTNEILKPYIESYLSEARNRGLTDWKKNYRLVSIWGNVYRNGDYINPHVHIDCDLSFVLCLKIPPIEMLDISKNEGMLSLLWGNEAPSSQKIREINKYQFLPQVGEIVIFPQNMLHYTNPIKNPQAERISISGNILLE